MYVTRDKWEATGDESGREKAHNEREKKTYTHFLDGISERQLITYR